MYYIVSGTRARVRIAYLRRNEFGYQSHSCQLVKRKHEWLASIITDDRYRNWGPSYRNAAEKYLYEDTKMYLCWNPKEFGGEK